MLKRSCVAAMLTLSLGVVSASASSAEGVDRKPTFSFTMSSRAPNAEVNGPLFAKIAQLLVMANYGSGSVFSNAVADGANLQLLVHSKNGPGPERLPFTLETVRAASTSCLGPYPYDEGTSWVQFSWVCRVDADAPLTKIMTLKDSPELTVTAFFEDGKIKSLTAMEPLPIPGSTLVTMNAYEVMKAEQAKRH